MVGRRAPVRKSRPIIHICRHIAARWKIQCAPEMQCVPLIVVEQKEASRWREISQSTVHGAEPFGDLIRVRQVDLSPISYPRRPDCEFPPYNPRAIYGQREENVRISDI